MEGFGVKKIMEELKSLGIVVKQVVHDKDASTMSQVMAVFEDVEESLCLCKFFIFKLTPKPMDARTSERILKNLERLTLS
jgi:hypothetical protein